MARGALPVFSALLGAGCLGGQTGTEETIKGPGDGAENGACFAEFTPLGPAELSPLGFSAESVLAVANGSRTAPLVWSAVPSELESFGPEQGAGSATLGVEATTASARFVHWAPRHAGTDLGGCAPDELQLDARVSFMTAGGAFSEQFTAVLHATRADAVQVTLSLPLATLNGTFTVSPRSGVRTSAVVLDATVTTDGTSGTLRGQLEQSSGDNQSVRFFTYACWPAGADACLGP